MGCLSKTKPNDQVGKEGHGQEHDWLKWLRSQISEGMRQKCVNLMLGSFGDARSRGARVKGPIVILKGSIDYDNDEK